MTIGGKEGYTNFQISAVLEVEPGTLCLKSRNLTRSVPNIPCLLFKLPIKLSTKSLGAQFPVYTMNHDLLNEYHYQLSINEDIDCIAWS